MARTRDQIVGDFHERSVVEKRSLWGFNSDEVGCYRAKRGKVPDDWTHICVEGDAKWERLPSVLFEDVS